jgi:hypothetical protein
LASVRVILHEVDDSKILRGPVALIGEFGVHNNFCAQPEFHHEVGPAVLTWGFGDVFGSH